MLTRGQLRAKNLPLGQAVYKYCSGCGWAKSVFAFNRQSKLMDGLASYCRLCSRASVEKFTTPEKYDARKQRARIRYQDDSSAVRDRELKREYGISLQQYDNMIMLQCGLCACCGKEETRLGPKGLPTRLSVHHNHDTGIVVALVCNACNVGMGNFGDDPVLMRRAAELNEKG